MALRLEHWTVSREDQGSSSPAAISKLGQFHSPPFCVCLSVETLKAVGPFYLLSMPGEVRSHTGGKCVIDSQTQLCV